MTPRGFNRTEAAAYVGCSAGLFDRMVKDGIMPEPRCLGENRLVWDRQELDACFDELPRRHLKIANDGLTGWDDVEEGARANR